VGNQSGTLTVNITLTDNFDLYAYEFVVWGSDGILINVTNETLDGTSQNIYLLLDVNGTSGTKYVNVSATDSHTAKFIEGWDVRKQSDNILFDDVRITAVDAVSSDYSKLKDRYAFEFSYPEGVQEKVYYIESDSILTYRSKSGYKAHFVDYQNRKWIDFEGVNGNPIVEKVNDKKWMVTFNTDDKQMKFSSVGGLNSIQLEYEFKLVNSPVIIWSDPSNELGVLENNSITLEINITGDYQNLTTFYVYNSSYALLNSTEVIIEYNGSQLINLTFTNLSLDSLYYANVTHLDQANNFVVSSLIPIYRPGLVDCDTSNNSIISIQIMDEQYPTEYLISDLEVKVEYWYTNRSFLNQYNVSLSGSNNYSICMYPNDNITIWADFYMKYVNPEGFTHRYYIINGSFTNSTQSFTIYNVNETSPYSDLKITARKEEDYSYYENVVATLQRYYVGEGLWRSVQMDESGSFGLIFFNIREENTDYRIIFRDRDNNILETTESMKFACDVGICDLTYILDPYSGSLASVHVPVWYSYDNATGNITVNWNDPLGLTQSIRVQVHKETTTGQNILCNITRTGAAGAVGCSVSGYTGEVFLRVFSTASPETPVISEWIRLTQPHLGQLIGTTEGAFWSAGIIITVASFGIVLGSVGAIVATIIGLIAILFLGIFTPITVTFVVIAAVLGIAIGVKVRT
jgi:hypothetical protein